MSGHRSRAALLAAGGATQAVVGLALLALLPQATDDDAVAWWLRLTAGLVVLAGVLVVAAAVRWWSQPGAHRGLPALATGLGVVGVLVAVLGGIAFVVDGGPDGGTAFVLGLMLVVPLGLGILLASLVRRESAVAAVPYGAARS